MFWIDFLLCFAVQLFFLRVSHYAISVVFNLNTDLFLSIEHKTISNINFNLIGYIAMLFSCNMFMLATLFCHLYMLFVLLTQGEIVFFKKICQDSHRTSTVFEENILSYYNFDDDTIFGDVIKDGLTMDQINRLPVKDIEEIPCNGEENRCPICLENLLILQRRVCTIPYCFHEFHEKCIKDWFGLHDTCPKCRCSMRYF